LSLVYYYVLSLPLSTDPAVVIQFAHNLLSLEIADQLSSVLTQTEEQTRDTIPATEQEWEGTCTYCTIQINIIILYI
jgi:hypothetical protein